MINKVEQGFHLQTKETSYCFLVNEQKHLEHLFYGKRVDLSNDDWKAISEKQEFLMGNAIAYSDDQIQYGLENRSLEFSSLGKGNLSDPFVEIEYAGQITTSDFLYDSYKIEKGKPALHTLPSSYGDDEQVMTLTISLKDRNFPVEMILQYSVFENSDVITRSAKVINHGEDKINVRRLMSMQVDLDQGDFMFSHFQGAWAREMNRADQAVTQAKIVNESRTGTSSNRNNPFVMLWDKNCQEDFGECYGFNLIYSGNHYEAVETNAYGKIHFVGGMNGSRFSYTLGKEEELESPEGVMTYSDRGFTGMSHHMHQFVRNHIVRGYWQFKERPVLLNSWEAAYFDIKESSLVKMAKAAKEAGVELFVMDDGWFGKRNGDDSSLGDWYPNPEKLPKGVQGLSDKINALGLDFGIWVEPEMISENSELYRAHPEYAVKVNGLPHSTGRNQMILDLTKKEVQDYVIEAMKKVFSDGNIAYVKWDMNRVFSDCYSSDLDNQGEFLHCYVMGLYRVMDVLTKAFPKILFEGCCAGGNRFDLGILCYMPQIWASDNTDAICRTTVQTGYSYGYPMSTVTAHVSNCPNHQTLRVTPMSTRFQVACFGVLGYECNLLELSKKEREEIKNQITLYKKYRHTLQYGTYYRIKNGETNPFMKGVYQWICVSEDQKQALGFFLQEQFLPNAPYAKFKAKGLDEKKQYHFYNVPIEYNIKMFGDLVNQVAPIRIKNESLLQEAVSRFVTVSSEKQSEIVSGQCLVNAGVKLNQGFQATGFNENVRTFQDYHSRLYIMEEK